MGAGNAVGEVDQPEVHLGFGMEAEVGQGRHVGGVIALPGDWEMHERDLTADAARNRVDHLHEPAGVGGLQEVLVPEIAVAEVVSELNVSGHL